MLKHKAATLLFLSLTALPSCIYVDVSTPLDINLDKTTLGTKVGRSQLRSVMGMVAWGDAGYKAAADDGGITTMTHADEHTTIVLGGLWYERTTIVYGN